MKLIQALLTESTYSKIKDAFKAAKATFVGAGSEGVVYSAPNPVPEFGYQPKEGYLVKITQDDIEMEAMIKAQGKKFKYLANIGKAVEMEKGGWYQIENLQPVSQEYSQEIKKNVRILDQFFSEGDKSLLSNLSPYLQKVFIGARQELVQTGIDPEEVDMFGDDNNVMATADGQIKLIDY
jgi:hypothetical protein